MVMEICPDLIFHNILHDVLVIHSSCFSIPMQRRQRLRISNKLCRDELVNNGRFFLALHFIIQRATQSSLSSFNQTNTMLQQKIYHFYTESSGIISVLGIIDHTHIRRIIDLSETWILAQIYSYAQRIQI